MEKEKKPSIFDTRERRKMVKMQLRGDLSIAPQKYEGKTYYVVKDPVCLRYYRFKEQEQFLLGFMDGNHTLDEAQKEFEKRFRPERLTLEDLESFAQQLLTAGLIQNESPQAGTELYKRGRKRRRGEIMQSFSNILYIRLRIFDPDKLLTHMLRYLSWIFTGWFMLLSVGIMLSALLLVATHFETFWEKVPQYHEFFSFKKAFYLWIALGVVKVIHEFGHGLSCKAFGGEVHEMGALFLVFTPCLYCNVSDAWTLPNKWHRIIISWAGIHVELIIASISTFVWWNTPGDEFVSNLSISLMIVCSVSTFIFNANPLMRYDGYYVLADWLEIPNLRDRSNKYLKRVVTEHCLGMEVPPEPYMALWRRTLFVLFATVSYTYRWAVMYTIFLMMWSWLKPFKLQVISEMLTLFSLGSMLGMPAFRLGKSLHKRGRLPDMQGWRVCICVAVVLALVLVFFLVPVPLSRVRQIALVQYHPEYMTEVPVPSSRTVQSSHILVELKVRDGQHVKQGEHLATFRNIDLENKLLEAETQYSMRDPQITALRRQIAQMTDPQKKLQTEVELQKTIGERDRYDEDRKYHEKLKKELVILATRDGVVSNPPLPDEVGKLWEKDQRMPFCVIGDPQHLRVRMPVEPGKYDLLRQDVETMKRDKKDLNVTLRVQGRAGHTWQGRLTEVPQSPAEFLPTQLTSRGGGTIAVKAGAKQGPNGGYAPQKQQYLIDIDILNPDNAICPGTLAQAKVHCRWRTTAWFAWRTISDGFDLGLF